MTNHIQVCQQCILGTDIPDVEFDDKGICNYCRQHEEMERQFPTGQAGKEILSNIVQQIKQAGRGKEYDCIVGVSGGADSTFTLYSAVQQGLRPLAVLFDNGWNSEIAVSNIKNAVSKLNVDLETFVVDWEEFKSILIAFLKASVPDTDVPTDIGIKSTLYRTADKYNIKYIIVGTNFRTEGLIPRKWSYMDGRYVKKVYKKFCHQNLHHFPNLTLWDYLDYIFIKRIKVITLLNYMDYHKENAIETIKTEVGWRDYGGKHYESIFTRFNQTCIRYDKFGFDMRKIEYAALVRAGQLTRGDALAKIKEPPYKIEQLRDDINYVIKKLDLSKEEFEAIYALPPKSFLDYPTYYPYLNAMRPLIKFLSKHIRRL